MQTFNKSKVVIKIRDNYNIPPNVEPVFIVVPDITYSDKPTIVSNIFSQQYIECCKCGRFINGSDIHLLILIAKQKGWQYDEDVQDMICPECLNKSEIAR